MAINLSQKVGPFPMGVWIAGVAGGLGLYEYRKRTAAAAATTASATTDSAGNPITDASGGVGTGALQFQTPVDSTGSTTTTTGTTLTDNNAWYQKVFTDLVAKGYQPALVDGALQRYLAGQTLSTSDWVIVNLALADAPIPDPVGASGQPPPTVTVPGSPTTPTPVTTGGILPPTQAQTPKPAPTQAQTNNYLAYLAGLAKSRPTSYTVQNGDTLATIAAKYYGNQALWANLYNANRNVITNPSVLVVGTKITLPASPYA